jgi:hypothetical protein
VPKRSFRLNFSLFSLALRNVLSHETDSSVPCVPFDISMRHVIVLSLAGAAIHRHTLLLSAASNMMFAASGQLTAPMPAYATEQVLKLFDIL